MFIILCGIALVLVFDHERVYAGLENFIEWIELNPILGPFLLLIGYIIGTICFLPKSLFPIAAGISLN